MDVYGARCPSVFQHLSCLHDEADRPLSRTDPPLAGCLPDKGVHARQAQLVVDLGYSGCGTRRVLCFRPLRP